MNKFLICLLSFGITLPVVAQHSIDERVKNLESHRGQDFEEKIYAHINRTDLITGEILWFSLYTVDGTNHQLSSLSKVAYVELLTKTNEPVLQAKVALENGLGHGSFYLPATLGTGTYLLKAYTNWMKNQSSAYFFQQPVTIVNTLKAGDPTIYSRSTDLRVELFPEGGQWVSGLPSQTGFKLTNNQGFGVTGTLAIINQEQDTVAQASTLWNGIGRLSFIPQPGESYQAIGQSQGMNVEKQSVGPIQSSGYTMITTDSANLVQVSVFASTPTPISMIVHTRQSIKVVQTLNSKNRKSVFTFDKDKLGDGVSHITIFDWENKPICERLIFKKPVLVASLETNQKVYNVRAKVAVTFSPPEPKGHYSLSIFRADSILHGANIVSNLLLTSDLTATVETPEIYFLNDSKASLAADNLMITHGWRRFNWATLNKQNNSPEFLPEVRGHLVQGKIVDLQGNPVSLKTGFLTNPGKKVRLYAARSDAQGNIRFQMKEFKGESKVIAQADYLTDSLLRIKIDNPFSVATATQNLPSFQLMQSIERPLVARSIGMQVQDIFKEDETYFSFEPVNSDSIPFYGTPDERYLLDDYTRFPSMDDVLREYVKGVWVSQNRNNFRFRVPDKLNGGLFKSNPLVLVDGVPVFNINQVMEIDPLKIKAIEIVARKYYIGPVDISGIVSFTSYAGDMAGVAIDPRSVTLNYEGLQEARQFYSPQYNTPAARASRLPDQRHQLYWNPKLKISNQEATTIEFYTSDVEGKFILVLEGVSTKGIPVATVNTFSVSR